MRLYVQIGLYIVGWLDTLLCLLRHTSPWVINFLRPPIVMLNLTQPRQHFINTMLLIKDTAPLILSIFMYVAIYAFIGFFIYKNTFEGYTFFQTPAIALYEMFICLTTSNFPNVMLPAYNANRWYCLFFMLYMLIGMYFLQNLLLAVIFENYKKRLLQNAERKIETREQAISDLFDVYDTEKKGYLDLKQTKQFLGLLLELDYKLPTDKVKFRKVMKVIDINNTQLAMR